MYIQRSANRKYSINWLYVVLHPPLSQGERSQYRAGQLKVFMFLHIGPTIYIMLLCIGHTARVHGRLHRFGMPIGNTLKAEAGS